MGDDLEWLDRPHFVVFQGNYGDVLDFRGFYLHYATLTEAEAAIDKPHALIIKTDHFPIPATERIPFPIRAYLHGDLVATLHNDQEWGAWMTGGGTWATL